MVRRRAWTFHPELPGTELGHPCHNIDFLGARTICYEADYPHSDTQWPRGPEAVWEYISKFPNEQINMMTHENALKAYHFDAFGKMGGREHCTVKALRATATHVDTTERALPGHSPTAGTGRRGRVTSADVAALFQKLDDHAREGRAFAGLSGSP
jgi:hypothetical protein